MIYWNLNILTLIRPKEEGRLLLDYQLSEYADLLQKVNDKLLDTTYPNVDNMHLVLQDNWRSKSQ